MHSLSGGRGWARVKPQLCHALAGDLGELPDLPALCCAGCEVWVSGEKMG